MNGKDTFCRAMATELLRCQFHIRRDFLRMMNMGNWLYPFIFETSIESVFRFYESMELVFPLSRCSFWKEPWRWIKEHWSYWPHDVSALVVDIRDPNYDRQTCQVVCNELKRIPY